MKYKKQNITVIFHSHKLVAIQQEHQNWIAGGTDINLHVKVYSHEDIFFCGEGPRSRCYERTGALRRIVQSCDEDD
jgi:hypothetical protein